MNERERLNESKRRWEQETTLESEIAYLLECLRVGELDQDRLSLAASCGYPAAREILGPNAPTVPYDLESWRTTISSLGKTAEGIAMVAVGRLAQLNAKLSGRLTRGPRATTLAQIVQWAVKEHVPFDEILVATGQVAIFGVRGSRLFEDLTNRVKSPARKP